MSIAVQPAFPSTIPPPHRAMTEEEFLEQHGGDLGVDFVNGQMEIQSMPGGKHGRACLKLAIAIETFAEIHGLGRACTNDSFVRIASGALRGADVAFLSHEQWPADREIPDGPLPVSPVLVGEVKSPSDSWTKVIGKVLEYLDAGVKVVIVLDAPTKSATVYRADALQEIFRASEILAIPDVLPGFSVTVAKLFE